MKTYFIKSVDRIAGLTTLAIQGNGAGLKNGVKISDNNDNVFIINSIAMTAGTKTIGEETVLVVDTTKVKKPIGTEIYC